MCGNCGQIVANTSRLLLQTPRTDSLGAALGLSDWLLENDIKYVAVCLAGKLAASSNGHFCPLPFRVANRPS